MTKRTGVSTASGWLAVVALAGAVVLLVPGWFGRPPGAWLLPLAAAVALATGWLLDPGATRATLVDGALATLGLAALLAGAGLLVASLVRLVVLGDVGALGFGLGGAAVGALLGSGLLATRMDGPPI
ncbi:hypothetical protein [Cellulomonas pakistanensis]|uniref:Uncharacterized protein n=1 Tax=Cellulomonas pakistanensis TaxID=992287 RepID=A0A919P8N1_9CELL|nr:hypothetical protein [Cellulomonas pakistanensis]GIG35015.1 hypothetical protein Cpa01nite_03960 [Cellulomonas pakistanensis]